MTYQDAVNALFGLAPELAPVGGAPRRFDLAEMRRLCTALHDPQNSFPSVLIAGTNGKGSTSATLASILAAAGYRVGLYTSPHLLRVNERIQIAEPGGTAEPKGIAEHGSAFQQIADDDFGELYSAVDEAGARLVEEGALPAAPSFFERLTAMAFLHFARQEVDIAVLEVGLGGRLDATNVVHPLLSIITDISLDHQEYLGNTVAEIAAEKCGILRENGVLVTLSQHPEANQAIGEAAARLEVRGINAAAFLPGRETPETPLRPGAGNHYVLALEDGSTLDVRSPLAGRHQRRNVALALAAAVALRDLRGGNGQPFTIPGSALERGVARTQWPGRLEWLGDHLLLDVAHNPDGAWALRSNLSTLPEETPRTLIFSCLRDKNLREMARILFPLFDSGAGGDPLRRHDHIILAPIQSQRAARVEDLLQAAHELEVPAHAAPHLEGALEQARHITPQGGIIVATGSVYLVGEIRELALAAATEHAQA